GDALAGAVLAFLAQGLEPPQAAALGVWVHNRAGHLAAERLGAQGILPRELPDLLGEAIVGLGTRA
ncbi:MAG: bifunctional ADP-dependent NAD(P)H-hydrate dehydratase/NAD(P)H-hydrate epimerase, partial [Fibrobacterales bacterium]|nr:bifunctional ADP-dependent NAD(P)H-hydrate dehydratase/NAD(P)H-hydrate epimerase [Fibrobacterales bacterium]